MHQLGIGEIDAKRRDFYGEQPKFGSLEKGCKFLYGEEGKIELKLKSDS